MIKHLSRALAAVMCVLAGVAAGYAATVEATVGDLKYSLDTEKLTASVAEPVSKQIETAVIPPTVDYENKTYTVNAIGGTAFLSCTSLTSVTISDNVETIGQNAFRDCSKLTSITLPVSLKTLGSSVFDGCSALQSIEVASGNSNYASYEGALYDKNYRTLIQYPCGKSEFTLSPACSLINNYACYGCGFSIVELPDKVTDINNYAFVWCTNLSKVIFGESIKNIEYSAFQDCEKLSELTVKATTPPNLKDDAFEFCPISKIYVPAESVERYKEAGYWSDFADKIQAIGSDEPTVEIKCDYTGCIGDSQHPINFNEIQIFEDEVVVTDAATIKENLQVQVLSGDAYIIQDGMSLNFVRLNVNSSGLATEGEFKVSYKGVECTFTYAFYNVTSEVVPAEATLKVGESVTFSMKLTLSIPGKEDKVVDATSVSYYLQKNGSNMSGSYNPFKFEKSGTTATLTALEGPDGSSYRVQAAGNYEPENILSFIGSNWIYVPVTIEAAEVALAVKLPNGAVEIKGADKSETPIAIIADEGWKISTVTLGGVGITDDIAADGSYTVPVLTESKELNVVFIEDTTLDVAEVEATAAPKVYVAGGRVRVEGAEAGAEVKVYDLNGRCLLTTSESEFDLPGRGVRILTVASRTYKFAL